MKDQVAHIFYLMRLCVNVLKILLLNFQETDFLINPNCTRVDVRVEVEKQLNCSSYEAYSNGLKPAYLFRTGNST